MAETRRIRGHSSTASIQRVDVSRKARRGTGLRVKVAIPVVVMLAVIITGLSVYAVTRRAIQQVTQIPPDASDAAVVQVYPFIFVLSIFGLAMGLALAFYVISPLRQLTSLAESASSLSATRKIKKEQTESGAGLVFGELGETLEQMVGSIGSYVLDAYILDSVASGFITISQEGTITSFNPEAERILGYGAQEVKGAHFDAAFPEHQSNRQFRRILHDGIERGVTVSSVEVTVLNKEEKEVLMGATLTPLLDEDGGRLGIVLSFKDLAAVKQAQARLQRADQLATLGSFAAGMAHEIRNPLASLQGLVELLLEDVPEEDPKRRYLNTIQRNLTRLTGLTENLLSLAHPGDVRLERTRVNDILREVMQLARHERQDRAVTTKEHYADGLPDILVDSEKLSRAILNVVINAFQATPEWGTVTLESALAGADSPLSPRQEAIVVAVTNTGSYIPPNERDKLFTPFYTTKDRGVGLGLAIAHQIVVAHSGQLTVESDPAHGTTFRLFLPVEGPRKEKT